MPRVSDMKTRLMDAAMDLIWENSYGTTSVDAICERAGAKKGSFYYFFKSKVGARGGGAGGRLEQEKGRNGFDFFADCSAARAVRTLL